MNLRRLRNPVKYGGMEHHERHGSIFSQFYNNCDVRIPLVGKCILRNTMNLYIALT